MSAYSSEWRITKTSWDVRKAIWERWALSDTIPQTLQYLELNADKYNRIPTHRDTVAKVRKEFLRLPVELVKQLLEESPVIQSLLDKERPELVKRLNLVHKGEDKAPLLKPSISEASIVMEAFKKHILEVDDLVKNLKESIQNLINYDVSKIATTLRLAPQKLLFQYAMVVWDSDGKITEVALDIEEHPLFKCLKGHLNDSILSQYEEWKALFAKDKQQSYFRENRPSEIFAVWDSSDEEAYAKLIISDKPFKKLQEKQRSIGRKLVELLALARQRELFEKRCDYCIGLDLLRISVKSDTGFAPNRPSSRANRPPLPGWMEQCRVQVSLA